MYLCNVVSLIPVSYTHLDVYKRQDEVTRVETRTIISSPDELAVATLEGFIVTEDMLGNYSQTTYGLSLIHIWQCGPSLRT